MPKQTAAVIRHCIELVDCGFVMLEQRFPTCVQQIHDQFPGDKCVLFFIGYFGKGKAVPLKAWTGPEDCRKLRLPDFLTGLW